jgi:hypothetical protein
VLLANEKGNDHLAGTQGGGHVAARSQTRGVIGPRPRGGFEGSFDELIGRRARFHHQRNGQPRVGLLAFGALEVRDGGGWIVRRHCRFAELEL